MKSNMDVTRDLELTGLPISFFLDNRKRYIDNLKNRVEGIKENAILFLKGGKNQVRFDNDEDYHFFLQESNFYYLTGVREENFYATINLDTAALSLFVPTPDERTLIFIHTETLEDIAKKYGAEAFELEKMTSIIAGKNPSQILVLNGINSDSDKPIQTCDYVFKKPFEKLNELIDNNTLIYEVLADTRTVKSDDEIALIRFAVDKAVEAHIDCMKNMKEGMLERDIENIFWIKVTDLTFCRNHPYEHICGCGNNSATLHYIENDKKLESGQLILNDMGTKLCNYVSDITCTVPVNGKFTDKQKAIYNIVLNANKAVQNAAKPGVSWTDMHLLAEEEILKGLKEIGLLGDFDVKEMQDNRVAYYFMPHGLGHFIGLEVHDVGGYLSFTPPRSELPGLSSLRTARTLVKGNVISDEPGIYFIPYLLEKAFKDEKISKYFNAQKIKDEYYDFGGVRIEDDLLILADGVENLSKALPRTVEEIEEAMKK
ncbi:MAG: aminopeptidase P family protein [archaeon]|nr:aminopeptidase P family protein [archaeon]